MSVRSEGGARSGERTASHRWALWILTQGVKGADGEWRKAGTAIRPSALTTTTSAGPQRYARRAPLRLAIKIVSPINSINGTDNQLAALGPDVVGVRASGRTHHANHPHSVPSPS